jgi:hypothetical protein
MNEPSNSVFCPLQILLCELSFANSPANSPLQILLCKTDAKQDEAGGKKLRDRMIPGGYFLDCGKSNALGAREHESDRGGALRRPVDDCALRACRLRSPPPRWNMTE